MPPRLLVTGTSGYLGHHLVARAVARGIDVRCAARSGAELPLDLDDVRGAAALVGRAGCDVVLHAAAMARMGDCDQDPVAATRRNGEFTAALCATGVPVVHVSTDLVFDGVAAPYGSGDEPRPLGAYGRSKRAGELGVLAARGTVVRVPLLFGPSSDGRRGATDMLRAAAADGRTPTLFEDEFRTPLHVQDAADALLDVALGVARGTAARGPRVLHVAGPERVSRLALAERFRALHGLDTLRFTAGRSTDPTRPKDVSLRSDVALARALDDMLRAS
ncbi:MAG: sugar nucleotide-binding protein [Planctomycetes bacterium]|nr:sugar nucleotide-binding protein [Planctomycetota bacterium]